MQIDRKIIGAFVLGIFIAVFVYQAYTVYQIRDVALTNQARINQIVNAIQGAPQPQGGEAQPGAGEMQQMLPEPEAEGSSETEGDLPAGE